MKIAALVLGGLHPSGREQVVPSWLALFSALARHHDVHAFALHHLAEPRSYQLNGFSVHDLGRPSAPAGLTRWAQARAVTRAMMRHGPFDVVHGFWGDPAGALAARMGRRFGIPSIATCDSGEFESMPEIDYGSQRTAAGRRAVNEALSATHIHVCTGFMARKAAARGASALVIPLTSVAADSAPATHRPMRDGPLHIVQVASLSRVKNQRLLIDALAILTTASTPAQVHLVGEDTLGGDLQRHAERAGVSSRVTFHGFVPQDRLQPILADADLYVQTSLHEAAAVAVLEAAAHGLPVVGTRVGYVADWAPDRAQAIDSPDAAALSAAILAAQKDPHHTAAMAARARQWVVDHDVRSMARQFDDLYTRAATRGR
jgi:glycosyltransferase involved in cell wall biosynthesis